jgi:uncharacterized protein YjbI with pentapeptide repeats
MDVEELLRRYAAGERDFSGVNLEGVNLVRASLRETILNSDFFFTYHLLIKKV